MNNKVAYIMQFPETIDDPNYEMETFGAFNCVVFKRGNGLGLAKINVHVITESTTLIAGGGELYSDSAGLVPLGNTAKLNVGYNQIYLKMIADKGRLTFLNTERITRLTDGSGGSFFSAVNAQNLSNTPYIEYNLSDLPENIQWLYESGQNKVTGNLANILDYPSLDTFVMRNSSDMNAYYGSLNSDTQKNFENFLLHGATKGENIVSLKTIKSKRYTLNGKVKGVMKVTGAISDFPANTLQIEITNNSGDSITGNLKDSNHIAGMQTFNLPENSLIAGDLKDLAKTATTIYLSKNENITYSGGRQWQNGFKSLNLSSSALPLNIIETILVELSAITWGTASFKFIGLLCSEEINLSEQAISARNELIAKGVTVTLNKKQ